MARHNIKDIGVRVRIASDRVTFLNLTERRRTSFDWIVPKAKPLLRWAGGKQWLSYAGSLLLPKGFRGTYYEPFAGGASLFFALQPKRAVLADLNEELINTYLQVKNYPDKVIAKLRQHKSNKSYYYRIRESSPSSDLEAAVRLIYLNRTSWNGLYRVNRKGRFNVPYGGKRRPACDEDRIRSASKALQNARPVCADFERSTSACVAGDFVYFDPPYITTHQNNGFVIYNSHLFQWADQIRLANRCISLMKKGIHVLVSNIPHEDVLGLYRDFHTYAVQRKCLIAADSEKRRIVDEVLFSSFPLAG